jgi:hypothetical protein
VRRQSDLCEQKGIDFSGFPATALDRMVEIIADDIRTHGALTHAPCWSYPAVREVFIKYIPEFLICGRRAFLDDAKLTSYVAKGT